MARRIHILGKTPTGDVLVQDCADDAVALLRKTEEGEPLQSTKLARFGEDETGHPVLHEIDVADEGPVMVNSESFRSGWERTFGKGGAN
jgi:hypothetical protein